MTKNTIIGIDLAKTVFQIAAMSDNKIKLNKRVSRKELRLCYGESLSLSRRYGSVLFITLLGS